MNEARQGCQKGIVVPIHWTTRAIVGYYPLFIIKFKTMSEERDAMAEARKSKMFKWYSFWAMIWLKLVIFIYKITNGKINLEQ